MPEEYITPPTRSTSVLRFVVIAVILVVALFVGLYFGKQYLDSQKKSTVATSSSKKEEKRSESSKEEKEKKSQEQSEKKKKQQQEAEQAKEKKEAEEKRKKAETETKHSQDPAAIPGDSTQPSSQQQVAPTRPSEVASTGPTETFVFLVSIAALSYGVYSFIRSRHELKEATKKHLLT